MIIFNHYYASIVKIKLEIGKSLYFCKEFKQIKKK